MTSPTRSSTASARLQPGVAGRVADGQEADGLPGNLPGQKGELRVRRVLGRLGGHLRLGVPRHGQAQRPRHRVDPAGRLPLDRPAGRRLLAQHRDKCDKPKIARIRAVLSLELGAVDRQCRPGAALGQPARRACRDQAEEAGHPRRGDRHHRRRRRLQIDIGGNGMTKEGAVFAEWGSDVDPHVRSGRSPAAASARRASAPFGGSASTSRPNCSPAFKSNSWKYRLMTHEVDSLTPPTPVLTAFLDDGRDQSARLALSDAQEATSTTSTRAITSTQHARLGDGGARRRPQGLLAAGDGRWSVLAARLDREPPIQLDSTDPEADILILSGGAQLR